MVNICWSFIQDSTTGWLPGWLAGEMSCLKRRWGAGISPEPGQEVLQCLNCNWVQYLTITQSVVWWRVSTPCNGEMGTVDKTIFFLNVCLWLILSFKWEDNEKENRGTHRNQMQRENRRHERRMPYLNTQIWIRAKFVSDNTNLVNCIVYLHIYKIHTSPFKITTSKEQRIKKLQLLETQRWLCKRS